MDRRRLVIAGAVVAFALVVCAGAFLNVRLAWRLGYAGTAIPYLGCQIGGFILTLLAAGAVVTAFEYAAEKGAAPLSKLRALFQVLVMLSCAGPLGLSAAWPVAAVVPACAFLALLVSRRESIRTDWVVVALCPAVAVVLFVLTWAQSANVYRQALRGLGERIEEKCGADRLAAWAADTVAAHPAGAILDPTELPDFVRDLSPRPEMPAKAQVLQQPDPYVQLFIGTGHSFTVAIHPSRVRPGATGPVSDGEWRPGIVLGTMGK